MTILALSCRKLRAIAAFSIACGFFSPQRLSAQLADAPEQVNPAPSQTTETPVEASADPGRSKSAPTPIDGESEPDVSDSSFSFLPLNANPQMFFDAQSTGLTRDGKRQEFKGDVVAVGAGVLMTADEVSVNRVNNTITAKGHVIVLTENQIFVGDEVKYHIVRSDLKLSSAAMIVNDKATAESVSRRVLGFTPAEIAFEEQKAKRLTVLEERKLKLRQRFDEDAKGGVSTPPDQIVDQYALLLEQEDLTKQQENPFLAKMTQDRRRRYKARRLYWQKGQAELTKFSSTKKMTSYFRIEGKTITREKGNDYEAEDAFWTPCKCDEDENPAWGFRSSRLAGQMEGYLDFYHPVLEIKGVPVLYLPYMKVPVKEKRQSGFLMPNFAHRSQSGNIYSQPVYLAIRDDLDATISAEMYEKRGTKLGLETRFQEKKYSGWTLQLEGMRDRVWMDDRRRREEARDYYFGDNEAVIRDQCALESNGDPNREAQCIRLARQQLAIPSNDWRGAQVWSGMSFLAPRLSFVSSGKLYSDHRYVEDLTMYQDVKDVLEPSARATMFSTSRYRFHLDAKNFYTGAGGSFGDNVLTTDRFQGQQLPYHVSVQSRMVNIDRELSPIPVYAQISGQHYQISDYLGQKEEMPELEGQNRTLGEGYWQRVKIDQVSPLLTKGVFKVDQFFDWEARSIAHSKMSEPRSSIRSWRTGITLNLPIDGEGELPSIFNLGRGENSFGSMFVRHYMNWAVTFSVRPDVFRTGPYGDYKSLYYDKGEYKEGAELVYFASDRRVYLQEDNDIERNETMDRHKRIKFETAHTWDFFNRGWARIAGASRGPDTNQTAPESYQQRAKRELVESLDRPIAGYEEMFSEDRKKLFVNRYALQEQNRKRVVDFKSNISYDFVDQTRREEEIRRRETGESEGEGQATLPQPWSPVASSIKFSLFDTSLSNSMEYNIYYKKTMTQRFRLRLPSVLSTSVSFGYDFGNEPEYNAESGNLDFNLTQVRYVLVSTTIIPNVTLSSWLGQRIRELKVGGESRQWQSVLNASYLSPSDCWGLSFQRQKAFDRDERDAEYQLNLSIMFMGRERPADISPGLVRELPSKRNG